MWSNCFLGEFAFGKTVKRNKFKQYFFFQMKAYIPLAWMHSLTDVSWQMKHSTDDEEQNEEHLRTSLLFTKLQLYNNMSRMYNEIKWHNSK